VSARKSKANERDSVQILTEDLFVNETIGIASSPQATVRRDGSRENTNLPSGWVRTKFGSICQVQGGFAFKSNEYQKTGIPLVRISNLVDGRVSFESDTVYLPQSKLTTHRNFILNKGDTLIAMSGATTGKMANFELDIPALLNQRVGRFRIASESVCASRFISLLVQQITKKVLKEAYGAAQPNISPAQIEQMEILLPPLDEQQDIVAEIEKQFTRLDSGIASLKRVQAATKRYRSSVLKAACEGRLVPTEAELARKESRPYETAAELVARIVKQRRAQWESTQLARFKAADAKPRDGRWKAKYKEPSKPEMPLEATLPEGWTWTGVEQLSEGFANAIKAGPFGSALKKTVYVPNGYKIYGQEQVIRNDPYFGDYFISEGLYRELESCAVKPGDVLISLVGTAGRVLILPRDLAPGIINPRLLKLSLNATGVESRYIKFVLESPTTKGFFKLQAHGGTMEILNLSILKSLPIPLPPLAEQRRIVDEIERRLSVVDELEAVVAANLKRAECLRQSILRRAFEAKLLSIKSLTRPNSSVVSHMLNKPEL
jgi:type I restriction enzyme S subunit